MTHDKLVTKAEGWLGEQIDISYEKWDDSVENQRHFWSLLTMKERLIVHFGDLYFQVHNGGFYQWHENGYSGSWQVLEARLYEIDTTACHTVCTLLFDAMSHLSEDDRYEYNDWQLEQLDKLDGKFYDVAGQALLDVVDYVKGME